MTAIRQHLSGHRAHMLACALAAVLVVGGIVAGLPALAVLGALMCGAMMVGMVWMMVSMSKHK